MAHRANFGWQLVPPTSSKAAMSTSTANGAPSTWQVGTTPRGCRDGAGRIDRAGYLDFLRLVAAHFQARPDQDVVRRAIARAEMPSSKHSATTAKSRAYAAAVKRPRRSAPPSARDPAEAAVEG